MDMFHLHPTDALDLTNNHFDQYFFLNLYSSFSTSIDLFDLSLKMHLLFIGLSYYNKSNIA